MGCLWHALRCLCAGLLGNNALHCCADAEHSGEKAISLRIAYSPPGEDGQKGLYVDNESNKLLDSNNLGQSCSVVVQNSYSS